jgi:hypothetical protein
MKISIGAVLLALAACAWEPQAASDLAGGEYREDDARIRIAEDFERRKAMCARSGGSFQVTRYSSGRQSLTADEMRMATCQ